jgi:hypothetical protein
VTMNALPVRSNMSCAAAVIILILPSASCDQMGS